MPDTVFFAEMAALALELIDDFGRDVTLIKNPTALLDVSQPELGPDFSVAATEETVAASFVPPSGSGLGLEIDKLFDATLVSQFQEVALIAESALSGANEMESFSRVRDGSAMWKIVAVKTLRPSTNPIFHVVGLKK